MRRGVESILPVPRYRVFLPVLPRGSSHCRRCVARSTEVLPPSERDKLAGSSVHGLELLSIAQFHLLSPPYPHHHELPLQARDLVRSSLAHTRVRRSFLKSIPSTLANPNPRLTEATPPTNTPFSSTARVSPSPTISSSRPWSRSSSFPSDWFWARRN